MKKIYKLFRILIPGIFIFFLGVSPALSQTQICAGDSVVLNLTGYTGTFQWQKSADMLNWGDISGAITSAYKFKPATSAYYRAKVTVGNCRPFYSDIKNVIVVEVPMVTAGNDTFVCAGKVMTLGGTPTAMGGTPPYTYSWAPATGLNSTTKANPTSFASVTTTYSMQVTDANGCKVNDQIKLIVAPNPTADAGRDTFLCSGYGVLIGGAPTAIGGTPPYKYEWAPSTGLSNVNVSNPLAMHTVTQTTNILYSVKVSDKYGCSSNDYMSLRIGSYLTANAGKDTGMCIGHGIVIGSVVTARGGTPPYVYTWTPATGLSNNKIPNPTANPSITTTYILSVLDANNCVAYDTIKIKVSSSPTADAGSDKVICRGGIIAIGGSPSVSGGTGPYNYIWTPAGRLTNNLAPNPSGYPLSTTQYKLVVTDYYRCTSSDSMILTVGTPNVEAGTDTFICKKGSIVIGGSPTGSGSKTPYTYAWTPSTGLSSTTIANPTASPTVNTRYKVTVFDAYNCPASDSVTIEVGTATVNAGTDIGVCIGNSTQIGGSPAASGSKIPYTYAWSPTSTLTSATIPNPVASPVTATNYILSVTDGYGCVGKDTVVVRVNALPVANAGPDKPWCTTAIAIGGSPTASGGSSPYSYLWTPSTGLSSTTAANPTTTVKKVTRYVVQVTDNNSCVKTDTMLMTGGLVVNAGRDTTLGSLGGTITVGGSPTASGGSTPYSYLWTPSTGLSNATIANPVATVSTNITYIVRVTDNNGCINYDTMNIYTCSVNHGSVTFNYTGSAQSWTVPAGSCVTSITVTCNGAGGGGTYGGAGGRIVGTVSVTSGETFVVIAGGEGSANYTSTRSGYGGGGFSGLLQGGVHIISAGGGGGGAGTDGVTSFYYGGAGGGTSGGATGSAGTCGTGGAGGIVSTTAGGGAGGTAYYNASNGTSTGGGAGSDGTYNMYSTITTDVAGAGGGGGYGTTGGTGGQCTTAAYYGGNGGFGGGGGGGAGGFGSGNNRTSAGGGGGGGNRGGSGGSVPTTSCTGVGAGAGGGGNNYASSTRVTVTSNVQGGGASTGNTGSVTIVW